MATKWSYSVGWRGYAIVDGVIVLATSANYSIEANPMIANGNTGYRYTQPAAKLNYEQISGSVDIELTDESYDCFTGFYAGADVAEGKTIGIYPAFGKGFTGRGWATSLGFSAGADALVTAALGYKSHTGMVTNAAGDEVGQNAVLTALPADPSAQPSVLPDLDVVPYYDTTMYSNDTRQTTLPTTGVIADVMEWNTDDSSEVTFIKLCGSSNAITAPDYVLLGGSEASGSFTLFDVKHGATYNDKYVGFKVGTKYLYSDGKIITESTGSSVQTGGSAITSEVSFTMVGGVWKYSA